MSRKVILMLMILSISLGLKAQEDGKVIDKVIAVIGSNIILKSDLESQIVSLRAQGVLIDDNARCELMEELLYQKLLLHQATIDSVTVSEGEVESEIDRRMNYFIAQIGSEKKLEEYYKKSIHEIKEEFKVIVKEQMVSQRMQGKITSDAEVTPKEVKTYFNSLQEDSIPVIESEVEYAQILFNAKESEAAIEAAKDKINAFRERIINGEDFSTLAILYSEDEGSAKKGGELGFMGRAELVPEFSIVAFKLKNKAVSEIVETEFGFHIIQLVERRGQKVKVKHLLVKVKIEEEQIAKVKLLADSVYNLLETDTLTFEELAAKYSDDEQTKKSRGLVVNSQTGTSIFNIDQVNPQVFYTIDKMKVGEVFKPVPSQSRDGKKGYRIIKLITKTEPHKASFDKDYSKIQNAALADKRNKATQKWVEAKIKQTYIKIDEEYKKCHFENSWVK
ncbi:MAG: peptidylprolyl isomerase [Flavobacteriales bacterium]|nr:peptidylprolyl isomerase [Flavobacteriales bacterium]